MILTTFLISFAIPEFVLLGCMLLIHELGHYVLAKRQKIYKGWGLLPNPHIKLTRHFPSRWAYLSGLLPSLVTIPFWCLLVGWEYWWLWVIVCVGAAAGDLVVFFGYEKLKKEPRK